MNLTPEQVEKNAHIHTAEIKQDIADTEREIEQMTLEATAFALLGDKMSDFLRRARLGGIKEREAFIEKLKALLDARDAASHASTKEE